MNIPFECLARPKLWERSPAPFWDDPHIAHSMLAAHLDPGLDAASRRRETIERSAGWILGIVPPGAEMLDLGCGPGLYTKRFSAAGRRVSGMDISENSLAWARERDPKTKYILGSYLEMNFSGAFDAATLIFCDYAALTAAERRILLARVRRALRPGGQLILDVFSQARFSKKAEGTRWEACPEGGFWSAEPYVCLEAEYLYEGMISASRRAVATAGGVRDYIIWDTCYTRQALEAELRAGGFVPEAAYDDICGRAYTGGGDAICVIARRADV